MKWNMQTAATEKEKKISDKKVRCAFHVARDIRKPLYRTFLIQNPLTMRKGL